MCVVRLNRKVEISVSLLSADLSNLNDDVSRLIKAGADRIHCDISDGRLIHPPIFGPVILEALSKIESKNVDLHFWLEKPELQIDDYLNIMNNKIVRTVYFPLETCLSPFSVAERIRNAGFRPGVVILPITPVSYVGPLLPYVDEVLIMTCDPTYIGRRVLSFTLDKVKETRDLTKKENLNLKIAVDGGIDLEFLPKVISAGADIIVLGSIIFRERKIEENIHNIKGVILKLSKKKN